MAMCSAAWPLATPSAPEPSSSAATRSSNTATVGIGDAAVDVAADLEVEQARGMVDVAEDEGRRLVDRHGPRAGDRVGMLARMQRQRVGLEEFGVDHGVSLLGGPAAVGDELRALHVGRGVRGEEHGEAGDLLGRGELELRLLLGQQVAARLLDGDALRLGARPRSASAPAASAPSRGRSRCR